MSDQGLSSENTPAVAGPEGLASETPAETEVDWQKRYVDLQSEYTRTTQENAEHRHQQELYDVLVSTDDPDTRRKVAEQLGYLLEKEEPEVDLENPFAVYDDKIAKLESALTQREEREREDAYASEIRRVCDEQLDSLGIDKEDQDWVLAYAINALPVNQQGLPDIRQAYSVFAERETARQRKWATTKRQAPRISPNGQPATEVPNLDNHQERVEWMTRKLEENNSLA